MKHMYKILTITLVIAALVGCQQAEATPVLSSTDTDTSAADPSADRRSGDLDSANWLALGTLKLEGTTDAVSPDQAGELLPLWQVIQGGSLKSAAETNAVAKQIENRMTASQLTAIEAMGLSTEDMQAWMAEQGIQMPARPEGQSGAGAAGDFSDEERAKMREQFQNMSAEERATRTAEMGVERRAGQEGAMPSGPGRGMSQSNPVLGPLVELLTARAAG